MPKAYDGSFFATLEGPAQKSAGVVLPLLAEVYAFDSVIDVGCGDGTWLSVFEKLGGTDFLGLDGEYVTPESLKIPRDRFVPADLNLPVTRDRRFDLAISLEVAEHLKPERADSFVRDLTQLSDVVLFSAAIPRQGGTNHVNEQWPTYWAERFHSLGYLCFDYLRPRIWAHPDVTWYYAQNTLLFVREETLKAEGRLEVAKLGASGPPMSLVHPMLYHFQTEGAGLVPSLRRLVRLMLKVTKNRLSGVTELPPKF